MSNVGLRPRIVRHLAIDGPLTIKELSERIGGKRKSVENACLHLYRDRLLIRREHPEKGKGYTKPYQYAIRVPEDSNE